MQNGSIVGIHTVQYTLHTRFSSFGANLYAQLVLINKISALELSRKFIKSALLVGQWCSFKSISLSPSDMGREKVCQPFHWGSHAETLLPVLPVDNFFAIISHHLPFFSPLHGGGGKKEEKVLPQRWWRAAEENGRRVFFYPPSLLPDSDTTWTGKEEEEYSPMYVCVCVGSMS